MSEPDRKLPCAARLCLPARHLVEGPAWTVHPNPSGVSSTPQEGFDDQKRKEIQRGLRADSVGDIVARDIGQQFRGLERDLPGGGIEGPRDSQAKCAEPAYAFDGILSISAEIYQFRRDRDTRSASGASAQRSGIVSFVNARTRRRKTGSQLHQRDSAGAGWQAALPRCGFIQLSLGGF